MADPRPRSAPYRLVIFDFDGTLADSVAWFLGGFQEMAERHGFRAVDAARLEELRGFSGREVLRELDLPLWKVPSIAKEMRSRMAARAEEISLFAGVDALLRGLRDKGVGAAIVTSNSQENVFRILGAENAALIQSFECGAAVFGKKSKLRKILKAGGVPAREVLCVGDEIRDAEAARAVGLDFIGVSWGYTKPEALRAHSTAALFSTPEEILTVV
jgi:phosphoglycolate phosphatase